MNDGVHTSLAPAVLDGIHTHPTMCNGYFYCNNGTQSADQFCPEGLLFNGQTCDFSHSVQCETVCDYGKISEISDLSTITKFDFR